MTYKELLIKDHPELSNCDICDIIIEHCPDFYFNDFHIKGLCIDASSTGCEDCWNRDVTDYKNSFTSKHVDPEEINNFIEKSETFRPDKEPSNLPHILDSGNRREFETGAVRDIQEGKGRCDLLPLDVASDLFYYKWTDKESSGCNTVPVTSNVFECINSFVNDGDIKHLYEAIDDADIFKSYADMLLEVSKHFEEGAKKYGDSNWQKGIPVRCYIDSAVRHYLKYLRGDKDEPHDRAFYWNLMCAIWTCKHKPELNDYRTCTAKEEC